MKNRIIILVSLCLMSLYSCNEESKSEEENALLQEKIDELESQLEELQSESIIIPYDSITNFVIPTTFHPEITVNEKGEIRTLLEWRKFPKGINLDCVLTTDNAKIKEVPKDGLHRTLEVEFEAPGEQLIQGYYSITFPNGLIKKYDWRAYPNVVKK